MDSSMEDFVKRTLNAVIGMAIHRDGIIYASFWKSLVLVVFFSSFSIIPILFCKILPVIENGGLLPLI